MGRIIQKLTNTDPTGESRSPEWPRVRKAWLVNHPTCAVCGGASKLEVHHKQPFHLHPELELDDTNFISLCEGWKNANCHLVFGHGGSFKRFNPDIEKDSTHFNKMIAQKED